MKITEIGEESLTFDNGCVLMSTHWQECCEWHWLDFSVMRANSYVSTINGKHINIYEQDFDFSNGVTFERVEGLGIMLLDAEGNKYLINGYNDNNGCYYTNIDLIYVNEDGDTIFEYDVSECQEELE